MIGRLMISAALALLIAAPALAQQTSSQAACTAGVQKLGLAVEVIGAKPDAVQRARSAHERAQAQMQRGEFFLCTQSVKSGLEALGVA